MATTKETKILYCGGIVTCDGNNHSKYKHGNDSQVYRDEFASLFIDGNTNTVITSATNPTDADAYILQRELDDGTVRSETLHVFESKCSPRMKCKYRRLNSTTKTIQLINKNTHVWSKDIDEGKMTAMVHYNVGERIKNTYKFPTTAKTDVTVTYDFVEGNLFPNQTTAAMFDNCASLVECELPCEMRVISDYTFRGCKNLTSYTKSPEFIESIGTSAFENCTALNEILIPEFASISTSSFVGCEGASTLTWNNLVCSMSNDGEITTTNVKCNMKSVPDWAFDGCTSITETKLKNSVGEDVVYDGLVIPMGITTVGKSAFAVNNYSKLWMGEVETIDSAAFQRNTSLTKIIGLSNVTKIEDPSSNATSGVFEGCINLSTIDGFNVNKYVYIGDRAFYGCTELTGINSTSMVDHLGVSSFSGCTSLTSFDFSSVSTVPESCFENSGLEYAYNTNNITSVGEYSFRWTELTSLTRTDWASLETIEYSAFSSCLSLSEVKLGNKSVSIGDNAFNGCTSLTLVRCKTANIGLQAFFDCTSLTGVSLTAATTAGTLSLGSNAFADCGGGLQSVMFYNYKEITASRDSFSNTQIEAITFGHTDSNPMRTLDLSNANGCFYDYYRTSSNSTVRLEYQTVCETLDSAFADVVIEFWVPSHLISSYQDRYSAIRPSWTFISL